MSSPSIDAISKIFSAAASDLAQAEQGIVSDKQSRTGLWGQIVDAVMDTPAEKGLKAAQERFGTIEQSSRESTQLWLDQRVVELIEAQPADSKAWGDLLAKRQNLEAAVAPLYELKGLGDTAVAHLEKAAASCNSAYWSEFTDALTSNKVFSVISALDTSSAQDDVSRAFAHANAFQDALKEQRTSDKNVLGLSVIDTVLDFTIEPIIDFMSIFNMEKLDAAERMCIDQRNRFVAPYNEIEKSCKDLQAQIDTLATAMQNIEHKYRPTAEVDVPQALRKLIDHDRAVDHNALNMTSLGVNPQAAKRFEQNHSLNQPRPSPSI